MKKHIAISVTLLLIFIWLVIALLNKENRRITQVIPTETNAPVIPSGTNAPVELPGTNAPVELPGGGGPITIANSVTNPLALYVPPRKGGTNPGKGGTNPGKGGKPTSPKLDQFGNPIGSEHDLCKDGAHKGKTIIILSIGGGTSLDRVTPALQTKGFSVVSHKTLPSSQALRLELSKACQIWIISDCSRSVHYKPKHIEAIKDFFDSGKGVYIWGDNDPCYADANALGKALLGVDMWGNTPGQQVVKKSLGPGKPGFVTHPITTGLNSIYEGITIATIGEAQNIQPIMRGSANNVVTAVYDRDGKRAVIDGGFTRLWPQFWGKTAGTARFVKNAACWLVNPKR
jgi:hypothetical protein